MQSTEIKRRLGGGSPVLFLIHSEYKLHHVSQTGLKSVWSCDWVLTNGLSAEGICNYCFLVHKIFHNQLSLRYLLQVAWQRQTKHLLKLCFKNGGATRRQVSGSLKRHLEESQSLIGNIYFGLHIAKSKLLHTRNIKTCESLLPQLVWTSMKS